MHASMQSILCHFICNGNFSACHRYNAVRERTLYNIHLSFAKVLLMFNKIIVKYITNIINSIICHGKMRVRVIVRVCVCVCTLSFSLLLHSTSYTIAAIDAMLQLVIQLNCCCFFHIAEDTLYNALYKTVYIYYSLYSIPIQYTRRRLIYIYIYIHT